MFSSNPIEPLADRDRHGGGHAFAGQLRQFFCQLMRFSIFYVQAHESTILPLIYILSTIVEGPHKSRQVLGGSLAPQASRADYWLCEITLAQKRMKEMMK